MKLTVVIAVGGVLALTGAQAMARPYLMLAADNTGFKALDVGDIHQDGVETAQITLISAPLAGAPYADKRAALLKQRVEFECQGQRWRVVSAVYADAKEVILAKDENTAPWQAVAADPLLTVAKDAACLRRYKDTLISRSLNLGDIVANYHRAWGPAAPEPMTQKELLKRNFEAGH